ncbi:MAG: acyl-CoA dehydrogenase protein [Pseudonocardiales bacterium]|nr:acyl-CoA dehydrogenase protein [Pseudonocardiales bacterium]
MTTTLETTPAPPPSGWLEPVQREIVPILRPWLAEIWPMHRLRRAIDSRTGFDRDLLAAPDAIGWLVPLSAVATPRPLAEVVVIAQEWGRILAPSVLTDLNVVVDTMQSEGRTGLAAQAARGDVSVAWGGEALPGYWESGAAGVVVSEGADGLVLVGSLGLVQSAAGSDSLLVAARDGDGVSQFLIPSGAGGVIIERMDGLDLTRDLARVRLDGVRVPTEALVGPRKGAARSIERQARLATVLALGTTTGSMSALLEIAVTHAKVRAAFGRPIGSFQAVKHQLVDASLSLEMSLALVARAAAAVEQESRDAAEILSMAKSFVGRAGIELAHIAWQVLAGMAYMWDNDFHLYLRRITADAALHGDAGWHDNRICELRGLASR